MNELPLTRNERLLIYAALFIYLLHIVYAILTYRFLYADGSHWFVEVLEKNVTGYWYSARHFAHLFPQLPLVMALKIGMKDIRGLLYLYGTSLFMPYVISLGICYFAARKNKVSYLFFPLLSLFAASMNAEFLIISESHFLVSLFWPLLFLMLFHKGPGALILIILLAFPTLRSYESMLFFGPILATIAIWRGLQVKSQRFYRVFWAILTIWFLAGIAVALRSILNPAGPASLQTFFLSSKLFFMSYGSFHYPCILSLLILLILTVLVWRPGTLGRFWRWTVGGVSAACIIVALLPTLSPTTLSPHLQYEARILIAYLPAVLACILCAVHKGWFSIQLVVWRRMFVLLALLGISQGIWHLTATYQWNKYLQIFRREVSNNCGLIPFEQSALSVLDKSPYHVSTSMNWNWTIPTMSIVIAQHGLVKAIVASPSSSRCKPCNPFNPAIPEQLPDLRRYGVNYEPYIRALRHHDNRCQEIK